MSLEGPPGATIHLFEWVYHSYFVDWAKKGPIDPRAPFPYCHGPLEWAEKFCDPTTSFRGHKIKKGMSVSQTATQLVGKWEVSQSETTGKALPKS